MTIFADQDAAIEEFKEYAAAAIKTYFGGVFPSDGSLYRKLLAAEADAARYLSVPLSPTEVFPDDPTDAELAELDGTPYLVEPGYDLTPDFFSVSSGFGTLLLRTRPILSVRSIKLIYPSFAATVFDIPMEWVRLDRKAGLVKIVPGAGSINAPLSIFSVQAMAGGYTVPYMIRVRYRAGIDATLPEYYDVRDTVFKMATLRLLQGAFIASSGSISADGLSESLSADVSKFGDDVDHSLDALKQKLLGPVWGVL
jgi:hypothetical protein